MYESDKLLVVPTMKRRDFLAASSAVLAAKPSSAESKPAPGRAAGELPFRQVHLDFHTSELIPDVASEFDAAEFLSTLQSANVNSINIFAKCHHGWAYYDTKVAHKHPSLKRDLLGEMIGVLRPAGIAANYYYSLVWDVRTAREHPEWRARSRDGKTIQSNLWPWMCMNTPYLDHVVRENAEILDRFQVDGGWWDILRQPDGGCWCQWCVADRKRLSLGATPQDLFRHNKLVALKTERALYDLLKAKQPEAIAFFNGRITVGIGEELKFFTHLEIESLPSGGWGYSHFEQRVRYCRTLGKELVGMTGRFHKSWGDFGGFKNQAALDFECLNFLANGAKACVGDQLHPRGRLDKMTYQRIGSSFEKVKNLEPHLRGIQGVADIGVMSTAAINPDMTAAKLPVVDEGCTNMLVELHRQFDVLDLRSDLSRYKVVILPDEIRPVPGLVSRLERYVASGGCLIVSHESLLDKEKGAFALKQLGVRYLGPAKFKGEYLLPDVKAFPHVETNAYFLYQPGLAVAADAGTATLARYGHPYFDRSPEHWCSHQQTPFDRATDEPVITRAGNIVYIANPFFRSYAEDGYGVQKDLVQGILDALLPSPAIRTMGIPSTARVTLLEGNSGASQVLQILYAPYERRALKIDVIEEPSSVLGCKVDVRRSKPLRRASQIGTAGGATTLPVVRGRSGYIRIDLPPFTGSFALLLE